MLAVFKAAYQICKPAPSNIAGPAFEYRRDAEEALVLTEDPQQLAAVIGANVKLKPGEEIEVVQWRQLGRGISDVFVASKL